MILVFGKTGQVARELKRLAPQARYLGREAADLSKPERCAELVKYLSPDAVILAAAYTAVDKAECEPELAHCINALAPATIARACADNQVPLVLISTNFVFDGDKRQPYSYHDPPAPISVYGETKLAGEQGVRAADGIHAIVRTAGVFSPFGTNFVKTIRRLSALHDSLNVVSDQICGPTPANAVAAACLSIARQLVQYPNKTGALVHLTAEPDVSWAEFARHIVQMEDQRCTINEVLTTAYPTLAQRPLNGRLDGSGLSSFGLTRADWRSALKATLQELKNEHD